MPLARASHLCATRGGLAPLAARPAGRDTATRQAPPTTAGCDRPASSVTRQTACSSPAVTKPVNKRHRHPSPSARHRAALRCVLCDRTTTKTAAPPRPPPPAAIPPPPPPVPRRLPKSRPTQSFPTRRRSAQSHPRSGRDHASPATHARTPHAPPRAAARPAHAAPAPARPTTHQRRRRAAGRKERHQIRNVGPHAPQLLILGRRHRGERRPPRFHRVSQKSDVKPA